MALNNVEDDQNMLYLLEQIGYSFLIPFNNLEIETFRLTFVSLKQFPT